MAVRKRETTALAAWYGSNRTNAAAVGKALEGCKWVAVLFAGGMSELRHIAARTLLVNDKHRHVINLAKVVADGKWGPKLVRRLRRVSFHPDELVEAQERCRRTQLDFEKAAESAQARFEWASDYFISAWMSRNGKAGTKDEFSTGMSLRYDSGGGDSAVRFRSATASLLDWRRVLSRATFTVDDVFDVLEKCPDIDGNGIYADPPFFGPGDAYAHTFTELEHRRLAAKLGGYRKCRVACRLYDVPLMRELYPESGWVWAAMVGKKQTNAKAVEEVILVSR